MSMTPDQMVKRLKDMGLTPHQRSMCMETYRDAGEGEAMERANEYLQSEARALEAGKQAAAALFGMSI